ncbi:sperm surface protein Sp17-like [Sycon ciliatum]|uniref:sperm surface protein Sp17-like n=1 Tax=Sycon ciliatum TaxID=27933 RepID=UPI0031F62E51
MSMKFAPHHLTVPDGFAELLESLTREILRDQPDNLVDYCAEYFQRRLEIRDGKHDLDHIPSTAPGKPRKSGESNHVGAGEDELTTSSAPTETGDEESAATEEVIDIDLNDPEVHAAASKIQTAFRRQKKVDSNVPESAGAAAVPSAASPEVHMEEQEQLTDEADVTGDVDSQEDTGDDEVAEDEDELEEEEDDEATAPGSREEEYDEQVGDEGAEGAEEEDDDGIRNDGEEGEEDEEGEEEDDGGEDIEDDNSPVPED